MFSESFSKYQPDSSKSEVLPEMFSIENILRQNKPKISKGKHLIIYIISNRASLGYDRDQTVKESK